MFSRIESAFLLPLTSGYEGFLSRHRFSAAVLASIFIALAPRPAEAALSDVSLTCPGASAAYTIEKDESQTLNISGLTDKSSIVFTLTNSGGTKSKAEGSVSNGVLAQTELGSQESVTATYTHSGSATTASFTITQHLPGKGHDMQWSASCKKGQTITFSAPATQTAGVPLSTAPTASSGLGVSLVSSTTPVCTVSGSGPFTVNLVTSGTCTLTASQSGDANYHAATSVTHSFQVNKATQSITAAANPTSIAFGASSTVSVSGGSGSGSVGYTVDGASASICSVNATSGLVTTLGVGTCKINAVKAADTQFEEASASASITIFDNVPPVLSGCPGNLSVKATSVSGAVVSWTAPTATDNVNGAVTPLGSATPGSTFPIGVTPVTYNATDGSGNTSSCTFDVSVGKMDGSITALATPSSINFGQTSSIGVSGTGTGALTYSVAPASAGICSVSGAGLVSTLGVGSCTINVVRAADAHYTEATASASVSIKDATAPVLSACPANIVTKATSASGASVSWSAPTALDDVDGAITPTAGAASGSTFAIGTTAVTYTATDKAGNKSSCSFDVSVTKMDGAITASASPSTITFKQTSSIVVSGSGSGALSFAVQSGSTGRCAVDAAGLVTTLGTGVCVIDVVRSADATYSEAHATASVTINDAGAPVISSCPANIAQKATSASGATVTWTPPTALDDVDGAVTPTGSAAPGATFAIGTTPVTYTATDSAGNKSTCAFEVTVSKMDGGIVATADPASIVLGQTSAIKVTGSGTGALSYAVSTGSAGVCSVDGSGQVTTTTAGSCAIEVTRAGDATYGETKASATVAIAKGEAPVFAGCPADITRTATSPSGAVVTWTAPTATDDIDGSVTPSGDRESGSTFAIGTTKVTYTATDKAGNSATCSFNVTVGPFVTPLNFASAKLPNGTAGATYATQLSASGGSGTLKFSLATGGSLPSGLALSASGKISGTPTSGGSFSLPIVVSDAAGQSKEATFTLLLRDAIAAPAPTIVIGPATLPPGDMGVAYAPRTLTATGGTAPYTFRVAGGSLPPGMALSAAGVLSGTPTAHGVFTFTVAARDANGFSGTRAMTLTIGTQFVENRTGEVNRSFMSHRAQALIGQGPNRLRSFRRFGDSMLGDTVAEAEPVQRFASNPRPPMALGMNNEDDSDWSPRLSFATSLGQIAQAARNDARKNELAGQMNLGATDRPAAQAAGSSQGFDLWVEGSLTHFRGDRADGKGNLSVVYVGVDYLLRPDILVGALLQFDSMEENSAQFGSRAKGHGWMAGPYVAARLTSNVFFDARALWGTSDNNTTPFGNTTDEFETKRWMTQANLSGNWEYGPWHLMPTIGVSYYEDRQKAYVDSNGVVIQGQTVSLGRLVFGPEVAYRFKAADGSTIEPSLALEGVWDFAQDGEITVNGTTVSSDGLRGRIRAGLGLISPWGYTIRALGTLDGLGDSDLQSYTGQLQVNMPLN